MTNKWNDDTRLYLLTSFRAGVDWYADRESRLWDFEDVLCAMSLSNNNDSRLKSKFCKRIQYILVNGNHKQSVKS